MNKQHHRKHYWRNTRWAILCGSLAVVIPYVLVVMVVCEGVFMARQYKYVARIQTKKSKSRLLRKLWNVYSLNEAWEKAKELYPNDKIVSVQLSKQWLEKNGGIDD